MVNWWGKSGNSGRFFSVAEFFLGSKITVDGDCSHKIKRHLLLVRKAMTNTDSVLKKRERHHFANKGKATGFPGVMYECVSWIIRKAEHWRIDVFKLWCWRRLLRVPWRKSTLNIQWKDWCWSWSSNNLITWCEELTHWKRPWCWGKLKAEEEGNKGWDGWMASPIQQTWVWANSRR